MSNKTNTDWLNFQIKTEWLIKNKKESDLKGNVKIPLKVLGLLNPYGVIKLSLNCIHPNKYNKNYATVGILKTYEYMHWDKEGLLSPHKILGSDLVIYLKKMSDIVERYKARKQKIYFQNKETLQKLNENNNEGKEELDEIFISDINN
ncbi:hypothetical protein [Spiroplasma sp. SV19]|uniref:hypothetical protein n=1 Tax=Spiroplasma sp. SV19 TaxID=2570468 RepID=UPI0024B6DD2D|nr:hypothetical protein [Spiroplasma sp. SV19]WHQ37367.1 hypothetical protein E7Y35_05820 [Spiroplasma sp. SV19]